MGSLFCVERMKVVAALLVLAFVAQAQAGYFECGVCQSLLHFWSSARVDSSFKQVCDAFPNYVPITYDPKTGNPIPVTDKDAPKDKHHGLPVTHMERCERVTESLLLRLAEEGVVSVKDTTDAQVFAPVTWENPAILEILCTYVYPQMGNGYCKGEYGGSVDQPPACQPRCHHRGHQQALQPGLRPLLGLPQRVQHAQRCRARPGRPRLQELLQGRQEALISMTKY